MPATLTPSQSSRRPRFRRVEEPPPFQLTRRDVAILHAVARYRFLSSTLIIRLVADHGDAVHGGLERKDTRGGDGQRRRPYWRCRMWCGALASSRRLHAA